MQLWRSVAALVILVLAIVSCRSINQPKAPSWSKAKVLVDREDHPSKIISDGESVYFVTGGTIASQHEGTNNIKRISLKDGSVSVLVKGGELIPDPALAIDEKYVYWSDGGNIFRVAKSGGASEKIIPNAPKPDEMVMDRVNIYWLIWGGEGSPPEPLMFASKTSGEPKPLTPEYLGASGIAIDNDFIYWMTGDGIKKIAKSGGDVAEVYHNSTKWPSLGLRIDANSFYFCQMSSGGHSALMKLSRNTNELTQLAPSINDTFNFVIDESNVYYFDNVKGQGSFGPVALMKVANSGGTPAEIDRGEAGWVKYLAVDAKQVYFTDISKVYAIGK
ncbi:MAG TPA: hypothetical protein VE863_09840 [Pyrinomonadaceae bacterium]|jgi:hypothetical protein|nr:hypothetical protein [Pyrinomonadaceae bacterium]